VHQARREVQGRVGRALVASWVFAALVGVSSAVRAQAAGVPADMQAELIAKLESYDRNFAARAGPVAHVLIVDRAGTPKSEVSAADMKAALARVERIGGVPHQDSVVAYTTADALAQRCRDEQVAVVYLTPGFDDDIDAIKGALSTVSVLTIASDADYVPRGVVLGFELVSGKPRILLNFEQARRQKVDFSSELLRLMKVLR
jgi:hypothetical protein